MRVMYICIGAAAVIGLILGNGVYLAGDILLKIYSSDPTVIPYGVLRLSIIATTYLLCGIMDVMSGVMRGLGYSLVAMIVSLVGACGMRILWIYTIFRHFHTLESLFISYPISWLLTFAAHLICFLVVKRKLFKMETLSYE